MSSSVVVSPASRCQVGLGRVDISPPIGIYHRFWGAAHHDQATGVHRPLTATVLLLQPLEATGHDDVAVLVALDHCLFRPPDMQELQEQTGALLGLETSRITFLFSHTHSGGNLARERGDLPGGDKIGPYLDSLPAQISQAYAAARDTLRPVTLSYGRTVCQMGHNRDFWDAERGAFVCGFNPAAEAGLPVWTIRMTDEEGALVGSIVTYPCHPTTLAWDNTLISPDYVGALREEVERVTDAPCVFLLGACGDVGPRDGFVGDPAVADSNGRQLAFAALSALQGLAPPDTDYSYAGPTLSGATIGVWEHRPLAADRCRQTSQFRHRKWHVDLDYRSDLPSAADSERELQALVQQEAAARETGDLEAAQQSRVLAERTRRLLERIRPLPDTDCYPYCIEAWQLGDAFWVTVEGEPYFALQQQLAERFRDRPVLVFPLANGSRPSYLPTQAAFERPRYQVEVALLAPGCLERVIEEIAAQIASWLQTPRG